MDENKRNFQLSNIKNCISFVKRKLNEQKYKDLSQEILEEIDDLFNFINQEDEATSNIEYSFVLTIKQKLLGINSRIITKFYQNEISENDPMYTLEVPIFSLKNNHEMYINAFYIYLRNSYESLNNIMKNTCEVVPRDVTYTIKYLDIIPNDLFSQQTQLPYEETNKIVEENKEETKIIVEEEKEENQKEKVSNGPRNRRPPTRRPRRNNYQGCVDEKTEEEVKQEPPHEEKAKSSYSKENIRAQRSQESATAKMAMEMLSQMKKKKEEAKKKQQQQQEEINKKQEEEEEIKKQEEEEIKKQEEEEIKKQRKEPVFDKKWFPKRAESQTITYSMPDDSELNQDDSQIEINESEKNQEGTEKEFGRITEEQQQQMLMEVDEINKQAEEIVNNMNDIDEQIEYLKRMDQEQKRKEQEAIDKHLSDLSKQEIVDTEQIEVDEISKQLEDIVNNMNDIDEQIEYLKRQEEEQKRKEQLHKIALERKKQPLLKETIQKIVIRKLNEENRKTIDSVNKLRTDIGDLVEMSQYLANVCLEVAKISNEPFDKDKDDFRGFLNSICAKMFT
ncbi:hypothetical protein TVAG_091640 [Trichomonas vaginalis G3]|uniref:Uncharacterized protein n=1 Tax=Trichomonas vaginalis (strain ATCC PRA-98 / G3) TaxID=412133 RepID=A2FYQ2_TRIV3|nr:hypothetical protein TVAGG3_0160640 [Trichomonas vaginalis G3]EAX89974.1 hypothetical protein TVAG_091640 [Trichomonas vaginalis G3]KAI5547844.1 hypothetical protein TVAGG3_0160640 [Trichomonas vaginalis G3]|eukprot:XP_001302904.1 hypothetical protein [Trichomonas vaginalis G3]